MFVFLLQGYFNLYYLTTTNLKNITLEYFNQTETLVFEFSPRVAKHEILELYCRIL